MNARPRSVSLAALLLALAIAAPAAAQSPETLPVVSLTPVDPPAPPAVAPAPAPPPTITVRATATVALSNTLPPVALTPPPAAAPAPAVTPVLTPPGYTPVLAPPGYAPYAMRFAAPRPRRPGVALIAAGAGMLGAAYLSSVFIELIIAPFATLHGGTQFPWLVVPVLGPFASAIEHAQHGTTGTAVPLLVFDGLVQVGGLVLLVAGGIAAASSAASPPYPSAAGLPLRAARTPPPARWSVSPGAPGAPAGLSLAVTAF